MADELVVWLHDRPVGTLARGRRQSLVYHPATDAPMISAGVRRVEDWTPERATAWFDGLLPEGETRSRMAARFGVTDADVFGLLEAIGWECAGAVSVLPAGRRPTDGSYRPLSDQEVGDRLDALPGRPFDDDASIRASLGGIQSKLVLARRDGMWMEPIDGAPSTHILKPEPEIWPGIAAAEVWAMTLAGHVTAAATAKLRNDMGARPVVIVTRFDRRDQDPVERSHQEDLCQLLGLAPGAKYAEPPPEPWKPSLARLAALLLARAADPPVELERLLRQVIVHVAIGNADAHAKNLSVVHAGRHVTLSPMYDVVPTFAYLPRQSHAALPVGRRYRLTDIGAEQVLAEAVSWGVPRRVAAGVLDAATGALVAATAEMSADEVPDRIREVATGRIHQFAATLTSAR